MALYTLAPQPWLIFLDDDGRIIPAGQLAIYQAGTSTPAVVFVSADGVPHPFPITFDSAGRIPGGLYLRSGLNYKFVLHEPQIEEPLDGGIIKTQDNVPSLAAPAGGSLLILTFPGIYNNLNVAGVSHIEYTGDGEASIVGMVGGVQGQMIEIRNQTQHTLWLVNEDPTASPGAQLRNYVASGPTPIIGPRSHANYTYVSTGYWGMDGHSQGQAIAGAFSAANYSTLHAPAVTWTVEPGDIIHESFYLNGRNMIYSFRIENTVVAGGESNALTRVLPFGWRATGVFFLNAIIVNNLGPYTTGAVLLSDPTHIAYQRVPVVTNWVASNNVIAYGQFTITLE